MIKFSKLTMMFWLWVDVLSYNLKGEVRTLQEKTQLKSSVALRSRYERIINIFLKVKKKDCEAEEAPHQKKKPSKGVCGYQKTIILSLCVPQSS